MPGTKDKTNTQSQTSRLSNVTGPLPGVVPLLDKLLPDALDTYGANSKPDPWTTQGMNGMFQRANSANPAFQSNYANIAALMKDGGTHRFQDQAIDLLRPIANSKTGFSGTQQQQYSAMDRLAQGDGYNAEMRNAMGYLDPIARGDLLKANPFLDDVISRMSGDIQDNVALNASKAGRYGSHGHNAATADAVGDLSSQMRFNDYNTQQGRQDAAIRDMFGMGQTGYGNKQSAIGSAFDMGTIGMGQKMDATGSLFNAGQTARNNILGNTAALSQAYGARQQPFQDMFDLGQTRDQLPWDNIAKLLGIATGAGSLGSTSLTNSQTSGSSTQQGPSRLGAGLGGLLSGWTMGGPVGGVLGGLGGAFF